MDQERAVAFARLIKKVAGPGPFEMGAFQFAAKWAFWFSAITWFLFEIGFGRNAFTLIPCWAVCFYLLTEISESEL